MSKITDRLKADIAMLQYLVSCGCGIQLNDKGKIIRTYGDSIEVLKHRVRALEAKADNPLYQVHPDFPPLDYPTARPQAADNLINSKLDKLPKMRWIKVPPLPDDPLFKNENGVFLYHNMPGEPIAWCCISALDQSLQQCCDRARCWWLDNYNAPLGAAKSMQSLANANAWRDYYLQRTTTSQAAQ